MRSGLSELFDLTPLQEAGRDCAPRWACPSPDVRGRVSRHGTQRCRHTAPSLRVWVPRVTEFTKLPGGCSGVHRRIEAVGVEFDVPVMESMSVRDLCSFPVRIRDE